MSVITEKHIRAAYDEGKEVFAGNKTLEDGIKELVNEGMNETSAQYYINAYVAMRNGTRYDMTIKIYATDYFLKNILADLGKAGLEKALDSVQSHLEYQENSLFNKQKTIRDIYDEYSKKLL